MLEKMKARFPSLEGVRAQRPTWSTVGMEMTQEEVEHFISNKIRPSAADPTIPIACFFVIFLLCLYAIFRSTKKKQVKLDAKNI